MFAIALSPGNNRFEKVYPFCPFLGKQPRAVRASNLSNPELDEQNDAYKRQNERPRDQLCSHGSYITHRLRRQSSAVGNATGNGTKERDRSAGSVCHRGEMATLESRPDCKRRQADCERDAFEFLSALAKIERPQLLALSAMGSPQSLDA
jgi:hypothetical protein